MAFSASNRTWKLVDSDISMWRSRWPAEEILRRRHSQTLRIGCLRHYKKLDVSKCRVALLSQEGSTIETAVEIVRGVVP